MAKIKTFISLEEAVEILDEHAKNLELEEVDLIQGISRILGVAIYSKINNPPFNKSAMDGYAINSQDAQDQNNKLKIIDEVFAGSVCKSDVIRQTAIKIMTGAPIPNGADAVVKQEDLSIMGDFIQLNKQIKANENICFQGEDIKVGTLLVDKNKKLDYADIGILASAGITKVCVYKKPKIALISTGDEVVDIGHELAPGKIYNSNKYTMLGRLSELGYEVTYVAHEADCHMQIGEKIKQACEVADLVITTGGASVGEKDLIKEAIDYIGGKKLFWKIKIKPGSAMLCSKYQDVLIISLSGNPTAALTTFELVVATTLQKLAGKTKIEINRVKAILTSDYHKKSVQRRFVRGYTTISEQGQVVSVTQVKSGNGILSSALNSNCLIELEAGNEGVNKEELVTIIKF